MSYLLDALKQSEHHDEALAYDQNAQQLKQQQELKRYRFIALSFGITLALSLTLLAGYAIGKWLQTNNMHAEQIASSEDDAEQANTEQETTNVPSQPAQSATPTTANLASNQGPQQAVTQPQHPVVMQTLPNQNPQYQWVQVPVNSMAGYTQNQPVLIQTPTGYQPVYNAQAAQYQATFNQNQNQQQQSTMAKAPSNNASDIDLSKYKVLGKPIGQPNTANKTPVNNEELDTVPNELKNAFAQAIHDTEQKHAHEVTQGTKNSSYAQPVELLPEGLLALLPNIKYQAHIYSSSADKRWIKLNNRELHEGEHLGKITVVEITPEQSVLSFEDYQFSLKALQDWPE